MTTVLLIVHLFVTLALIGLVLIQRSEGGGLGIGSTQGAGAFMTGRGAANLLTRTTSILAALFFGLSLVLALLNRGTSGVGGSVLDTLPAASTPAASTPAASTPATATPTTTPAASTPAAGAPAVPAAAPAPAKGPAVPTN